MQQGYQDRRWRQDRVILENPAFHILLNLKTDCPFAADRDTVGTRQQFYIRVVLQLLPDGFLGRSGESMISGDLVVK